MTNKPPPRRYRTPKGDRVCDKILFTLAVKHDTYSGLAKRMNLRRGTVAAANQVNRHKGLVRATKLLRTDKEPTFFLTDEGKRELLSFIDDETPRTS